MWFLITGNAGNPHAREALKSLGRELAREDKDDAARWAAEWAKEYPKKVED